MMATTDAAPAAWRRPDFWKLWMGQSVSAVGTEVTEVAMPLVAVLTLHVGSAQLGLVNAARWAPYLLLGLLAGVYADRLRRRRLMIAADLGRFLILLTIVFAAQLGYLGWETFLALVFGFGALTVIFEVAYHAYVPGLVGRDGLVGANSRLQTTASVARMGGPALGGWLVALLSAPFALLADALSFLASLCGLVLIRTREPRPQTPDAHEGLARSIGTGLQITYRNRYLRALVGLAATYNFFDDWILTLFLLYAVHQLGFGAAMIGVVMAAGAVGATLGSMITGWSAAHLGLGRTLFWTVLVESVALLAVPAVAAHHWYTIPVILTAFCINGVGVAASSVTALTVRQALTPDALLGRMTASYRFVSYGAVPLGAVVGGLAGSLFGVRAGLLIGAVGMIATIVWVICSPLPSVRSVDEVEALAPGSDSGDPVAE